MTMPVGTQSTDEMSAILAVCQGLSALDTGAIGRPKPSPRMLSTSSCARARAASQHETCSAGAMRGPSRHKPCSVQAWRSARAELPAGARAAQAAGCTAGRAPG